MQRNDWFEFKWVNIQHFHLDAGKNNKITQWLWLNCRVSAQIAWTKACVFRAPAMKKESKSSTPYPGVPESPPPLLIYSLLTSLPRQFTHCFRPSRTHVLFQVRIFQSGKIGWRPMLTKQTLEFWCCFKSRIGEAWFPIYIITPQNLRLSLALCIRSK